MFIITPEIVPDDECKTIKKRNKSDGLNHQCYGQTWREKCSKEKFENAYMRIKIVTRRKYFPGPKGPVGPFIVDPAYTKYSLRKKPPSTGTSSASQSTSQPPSSCQSPPFQSAIQLVTRADIHVEDTEILNKSKINYKDEGNRHSINYDHAEPSTSHQFQSTSSFPRSVLKKAKSKYSSTDYRPGITDVLVQRRESRNIQRDFRTLKRRSASLDYYRAPRSYDRTYTLPRTRPRKSYNISPIRIPRDQIKYKRSLANSIPISSQLYSDEYIHDLPYYYKPPTHPYYLRLPPIELGISPPPSPAPDPTLYYGQSYIPDEEEFRVERCPQYYSTPTSPEPVPDPFLTYRQPIEVNISDEEEEEPVRYGYSPTSPSLFLPCDRYRDWYYNYYNTWKRGRSTGRSMGRMNSLDHERKIIIEFCHLLEKSKQLFNGLRELPQYGHKQWHSYFGRTFDVYTKLWKFQQQHRDVLNTKYGLKRWQIGEIASKIGQLYYHFYLRTSDTTYLNEAFSFYHAIRARCYYTKAAEEDKCELMVKKLRYYARFIVVCLLLKKIKLVRELAKELDRQIIEYANTYDPTDQVEWTVVVDEVKAFIQAEPILSVIHPDNYCVTLSYRLRIHAVPPLERNTQMPAMLSLQEVLIVGNSAHQVKFSELTMDMFRILQTLEREPSGDAQHLFEESPRQRYMSTPCAPITKGPNVDGTSRRENPHKFLLFKPAPSQVLVYLGSGCHDLPPGGALLLYISADGQMSKSSTKDSDDPSYSMGGLITTSKFDLNRDCKDPKNLPPMFKEPQCLYPGDLYAFTRKPMFLILDSDNSFVFQHIPRNFGQPLVVLMSPIELPPQYQERKRQGNLFTLFLHSPLTAICLCCEIHTMSLGQWERAQSYVENFMIEVAQLFGILPIDLGYMTFMGDDFLRLLVFRYIFCEVALRSHKAFKNRNQLPRAIPALPEELLEHPTLVHIILDLAAYLQVKNYFGEPTAGPSSSQKE